jgi:hypothetical protein
MPRTNPPDDFRPEESPIAWFGEMLLSIKQGAFHRVSQAQAELARLGWNVTRRTPRQGPRNAPHDAARREDGK